jgi:suppressor for copper-sensitivity B
MARETGRELHLTFRGFDRPMPPGRSTSMHSPKVRTRERERSPTLRRPIRWAHAVVAPLLLVGLPGSARAASTSWVGDRHASARLVTGVQATGSAPTIEAGFEIRMEPGWHTYWRTPGDAGIAPVFDWKGSTNLAQAEITWPAPTRLSLEGLETYGYPDHVLLPIIITLSEPGQPAVLRAAVDYAACAKICVPYHASLSLSLPAGPAAPADEAKLIAAARADVPTSLDNSRVTLLAALAAPLGDKDALIVLRLRSTGGPFRQPDLFLEGLPRGHADRPKAMLTDGCQTAVLSTRVWGVAASALAATPLTFTLTDRVERAVEFKPVLSLGTAGEAESR